MFEVSETNDLEGLQQMFLENGLEVSEEKPGSGVLIKCWEIVSDASERIAGLRMERRNDEFVIVGISVDNRYRRKRLGALILETAIDFVRRQGGKRVILVARAPGFFKRAGFAETDISDFSGIISCESCEQLKKDCFPAFMSLPL